MRGLVLGAEQAGAIDRGARNGVLDAPLRDQREEPLLVVGPIAPVLLVGVEHLLRRRELRLVRVLDAADCLQEVPEDILLRESGELGDVVEAYVEHLLDPRLLEPVEERLGGGFREADREDLHWKEPTPIRREPKSLATISRCWAFVSFVSAGFVKFAH